MCMYLTNGNFLGQRLIGYDCYESKSKGFIGMSEKQIIDKLKKVSGFTALYLAGKRIKIPLFWMLTVSI